MKSRGSCTAEIKCYDFSIISYFTWPSQLVEDVLTAAKAWTKEDERRGYEIERELNNRIENDNIDKYNNIGKCNIGAIECWQILMIKECKWDDGKFAKDMMRLIWLRLSVRLSVCLSICLPACLFVCLSICLTVSLSVFVSVYLSVNLPVCLSVSFPLSITLSLSFSLSLTLFPTFSVSFKKLRIEVTSN